MSINKSDKIPRYVMIVWRYGVQLSVALMLMQLHNNAEIISSSCRAADYAYSISCMFLTCCSFIQLHHISVQVVTVLAEVVADVHTVDGE